MQNNSRSRSKDLAADPDEHPVSSPRSRVVPEFDQWNYISMELLAKENKGQVSQEGDFLRSVEENFTLYYQPLIPWVNRLRKVVVGKLRGVSVGVGMVWASRRYLGTYAWASSSRIKACK